METISVNGETFIKANILARELGYTADYVGQLCRGGKVKAELVGRSWYVEPSSLRTHKKSRYRSAVKKSQEQLKEELTKLKPVVESQSHPVSSFRTANYQSDQDELIPMVIPKEKRVLSEPVPVQVIDDTVESLENVAVEPEIDSIDHQEQRQARSRPVVVSDRPRQRKHRRLEITPRIQPERVVVIKSGHKNKKNRVKRSHWLRRAVARLFFLLIMVAIGLLLLSAESQLTSVNGGSTVYQLNFDNLQLLADIAKKALKI